MKPRNGKHFHQSKYAKALSGGVERERWRERGRGSLESVGRASGTYHACAKWKQQRGSSSNNIQKLMACNYLLQLHESSEREQIDGGRDGGCCPNRDVATTPATAPLSFIEN